MSFTHVARSWLVLGSVVVGSFGLLHCSSKDEPSGGDGGTSGGGVPKGGSVAVAGSNGVGKAGASLGGMGGVSSGGSGGSTAGKGGSSSSAGAASSPQCKVELDCGAGQMCTDGKCVVKACTPPPTAFQFTPATAAKTVSLAGSLNAWSTTASPLTLDQGSGAWKGSFQLDAGTYQYKFVVDGTTWIADPKNPDTVDDGFCGFNSQLTIGCDGVEPPQGLHGNGCPPEGGAGAGGASADGAGGSD